MVLRRPAKATRLRRLRNMEDSTTRTPNIHPSNPSRVDTIRPNSTAGTLHRQLHHTVLRNTLSKIATDLPHREAFSTAKLLTSRALRNLVTINKSVIPRKTLLTNSRNKARTTNSLTHQTQTAPTANNSRVTDQQIRITFKEASAVSWAQWEAQQPATLVAQK